MVFFNLIGLVGAAALGFAVTGSSVGLDTAAGYLFDALVAFACWCFQYLLDIVMYSVVIALEALPGGFLETSTLAVITDALGWITDILPAADMILSTGVYFTFVLVWIALRTLLRLAPGVV